jgi:hypothetical protein
MWNPRAARNCASSGVSKSTINPSRSSTGISGYCAQCNLRLFAPKQSVSGRPSAMASAFVPRPSRSVATATPCAAASSIARTSSTESSGKSAWIMRIAALPCPARHAVSSALRPRPASRAHSPCQWSGRRGERMVMLEMSQHSVKTPSTCAAIRSARLHRASFPRIESNRDLPSTPCLIGMIARHSITQRTQQPALTPRVPPAPGLQAISSAYPSAQSPDHLAHHLRRGRSGRRANHHNAL